MIAVRDEDTLTIERFAAPPAAPEKPKPEEKEDPRDIQKRARKPPAEGPCKRCGQSRPLNRLFLCYPCWVKVELEKKGWREGQSHPSWCTCELECRIESKGGGN